MSRESSWKKWLLFINLCLLLTAILFISRSFIIGYAASAIFIINIGQSKRGVVLTWILWVLTICTVSILLKFDSSQGRLLIYKVAWSMYCDNWLTGIGLGNFELLYGHYQASYFSKEQFSISELLLADNSYYAFNDYFQFVIELGSLSLLLLIIGFFSIIALAKSSTANATTSKQKFVVYLSITQLLAIGTAALFTHVVEKVHFQFILTICVLVLIWYSTIPVARKFTVGMIAMLQIAFTVYHVLPSIMNARYYEEWENARAMKAQGANLKALSIYERIYDRMSRDGFFLQEYGDLLYEIGNFSKAMDEFQKSAQKRTTHQLYLRMASCLEESGQILEAENNLLKAVNMVPNRFNSRFRLFRFYMRHGLYDKARLSSERILSMPVKIPSQQIDYIQRIVLLESAQIKQ